MRKQVGQIDAGLLDRVDALASDRGQTRRVVVERALEAVLSEAKGAPYIEPSGPAPVPSTPHGGRSAESVRDGARPAAQPRTHGVASRDVGGDGGLSGVNAGEAADGPASRGETGGQVLPPSPRAPGLRSNGHLPSCKCWKCEKLGGAT